MYLIGIDKYVAFASDLVRIMHTVIMQKRPEVAWNGYAGVSAIYICSRPSCWCKGGIDRGIDSGYSEPNRI